MSDALSLILIVWWTVLAIIYLGFLLCGAQRYTVLGTKKGYTPG